MMETQPSPLQIEPRWPVALAILIVIGLLTALPDRIKLLPLWFPYVLAMTALASIAAVPLTRAKRQWLRMEGWVMFVLCLTLVICTSISLGYLLKEMVTGSKAIDLTIRVLGLGKDTQ